MNLLQSLHHYGALLWSWHIAFYHTLVVVLAHVFCKILKEILDVTWQVLGGIPIPDELLNFVWPDPGPMGSALIAVGVPEAMVILLAAFNIKLAMRLLPLIMAA